MDGTGSSITDAIGRFVLETHASEIPPKTRRLALILLLDTLGVCAAAGRMEASAIASAYAVRQFGTGADAPGARLPFDGRWVSIAGAAYASASRTDNLDGHDGFAPAKGHAGVALVPTLLAFAQSIDRLNGEEALTSLVIGYEIACRAALALHGTVADYHTSGAWNALGVVALGGRLRGLDRPRLRQALGIAEYHGPRSQMMREIDNPTMLHDGSGWGALAGASAVFLAEDGFTGAPAITAEADPVAHLWADLGRRWYTDEQYVKPYPVCRWAHAPIDGALRLRGEHDLAVDDIAEVRINTFHEAARLAAGMPESSPKAQYSLAFPVAAALARGRVGVEEVTGAALADPLIERLVRRTTVTEDARHQDRFPDGRWADLTLVLEDGRRLASGDIDARGGPAAPLSEAEIVEKFKAFATPAIGEARVAELVAEIGALDGADVDFTDLIDRLISPA